jgi:Na+/proline symporter
LVDAIHKNNSTQTALVQHELTETLKQKQETRSQTLKLIKQADKTADVNDTNYIFLYFVTQNLPKGLIGLLIAVIFLAAWGSIAAALNSLASSTVIDVYKRLWYPNKSNEHYYHASRWITLFWGLFCIATAMFASQLGSLIEAVNILGSLFYGTMLGIFVVAFYMKKIGSRAVFYAAIIAESGVIAIYVADIVSFLWLNVIGCLLVMLFAQIITWIKAE